jgi:hypothetical protein
VPDQLACLPGGGGAGAGELIDGVAQIEAGRLHVIRDPSDRKQSTACWRESGAEVARDESPRPGLFAKSFHPELPSANAPIFSTSVR